jgi:agmatine deiminase
MTRTPAELGFRMPAEWEPHAATWLAWPHARADWPGKAAAIAWVFAEFARQIARSERVRLLVSGAGEERVARHVLGRAHVDLGAVDFFRARTDRSWTRDYLPTFVVRGAEVGAVKWRFNGWARYPNHRDDDAAGQLVAEARCRRRWLPTASVRGRSRRVVLEGGAIDVDGQGTLITTEPCLVSGPRGRNRGLGREGVERVLGEYLGVSRVLWLQDGIAGDDTAGHVDDFVRFVAPGQVVLCEEKRRSDPNHRVLERARESLAGARDARGRRLGLIRLPMPDPVHFGRHRLPASYASFYLCNETVIVPTFNDPCDSTALGILADLFPRRRVVGVHCLDLVLGLGTLHCSSMQEPARG